MPVLKTEFCCPRCSRESGQSTQILAAEGRLSCPANSNHRWEDTAAFYAENPQMTFKVGPAKFPPVEGQTPITMKVPQRIKDALTSRYAGGVDAAVAEVLLQLVDGDVMIVGETDKQRLFDRLGQKFSNSSELVGVVYAKMCEVDEVKAERDAAVADLKAYEGRSIGRVVVDLGDQYATAQAKAKDAEQPLKQWVDDQLRNALTNNWF